MTAALSPSSFPQSSTGRLEVNSVLTRWGKSLFNAGEDIRGLLQAGENVNPVQQLGGNFQRVIDAGREIGIDRLTGTATQVYTVITNAAGYVVTAFPGWSDVAAFPLL